MNNKGQSLILFVLLIPVLLLILFLVYDMGNIVLLKEKLDNINYIVIDYGLDNLDNLELETKLNDMINKNKNDIDKIDINIENNIIKINLKDKISNKISILKNFDNLDVSSSYIGYLDEDKKIIRKDK